jgi:phosphoglycolate phosphatase
VNKGDNQKYVVFDFDGTLADTLQLILKVYRKIAPEYNIPLLTDKEVEELRERGAGEIIRKYKIPFYKLPIIMLRGYKEFSLLADQVELFEGIVELINNLVEQNFKLGILSSNSKENVEKVLSRCNLLDKFEFVHTGKQIFSKDKKLKNIMKDYKISNKDIVYVGDESRDIEAANKAEIKSIAVLWGFNSHDLLTRYSPSWLVENPNEILNALDNLL